MAFTVAYPALMVELIIGRYAQANAVTALRGIANNKAGGHFGALTGYVDIITATLIPSFYAIVAGCMVAYLISPAAELAGFDGLTSWLTDLGTERNILFTVLFMSLTIGIICGGVITLLIIIIIINFDTLFGPTVRVTTRYSQPLLGMSLGVFAGWIWNRNQLIDEIKQDFDGAEHSLFVNNMATLCALCVSDRHSGSVYPVCTKLIKPSTTLPLACSRRIP